MPASITACNAPCGADRTLSFEVNLVKDCDECAGFSPLNPEASPRKQKGVGKMLVLSRKKGERITIGEAIVVTVLRSSGGRVTLGITAPDAVSVHRSELGKPKEGRPLRLKA